MAKLALNVHLELTFIDKKNNLEKCWKLTPILVKIPPKIISFYIFTNERLKTILILFEFKNRSKGSSLVKKLLTC